MELDPMEECRSLLRERNEATFFQRLRWNYLSLPSKRFIGFGVILCLLVSVAFLLAMRLFSSNKDFSPENIPASVQDGDEIYPFNKTGEETIFLNEWKSGKKLLHDQREQLNNFYKKVLSQRNFTHDVLDIFFSDTASSSQMVDCALILEHVKRTLKKCVSIDILPEECLKLVRNTIECDSKYPYRTINGVCNNLINPSWGSSGTSYLRLLKADYADDVSTERLSVFGVELPNPRLLSNRVYGKRLLPNAKTTMLFMNYGLFLAHDLVRSLLPNKDVKIDCCEPEVLADPRLRHPSCNEVMVPLADTFYIEKNVTCLTFYRSTPAIGKCPGRREQTNLMTAYIDLSDTYGPTEEECNKLRAFEGGKLNFSIVGNTPVLPQDNESGQTCFTRDVQYKCFKSGDARTNMQVELMTMHNIWLREHNRIAEKLQIINPQWNDETLFQEARRINIAQFQHITYNEYLPYLFGKERMKKFRLEINPDEYYDDYDETVEAGIYNAFSTAAFRFGHALVQDEMEFRGANYKLRSKIPVHKIYTNPTIIYKNGIDDIVRGMSSQPTQQTDRYTTTELRNRLLQRFYSDHGMDLSMITIQRGRDMGIPPYTKWRQSCRLEEIHSWEDMYKVMDKIRVDELREMYMSVDDVDLVAGGLSEHHLEGASIGPTYACIMRRQFRNLRIADRFWFENRDQIGSFTQDQLREIYKSNIARVLCDTSDDIETIPKFPFQVQSKNNPRVFCDTLPKVDLSLWSSDLQK